MNLEDGSGPFPQTNPTPNPTRKNPKRSCKGKVDNGVKGSKVGAKRKRKKQKKASKGKLYIYVVLVNLSQTYK